MGKSEKLEFFARLNDEVEKQYVNNYLTPASNNWQRVIDKTESWVDLDFKLQRNFFKDHVKETLDSGGKLAVVISDGLRYEVAEALSRDIEGEGRFECDLDWMVGSLPSYTALGMAALLPNKELMIHTDGSVKVDGQSSAGLENRNLVLSSGYPKASKAMLASDYKRLNTDDRRALIRNHHVLYLYHNRIDAIADKRESEDETVDAVDMAIQEIVDLVKSLYGGNVNKIIMTTDHGFMYQNQKLEDTDLNSVEVSGKEIYLKKRRFIVGKELENNNNVLKHFSAKQLGLAGDYEVLLAKSVNRIRVSGAGMQYVHGGSSLQEIVLPVLTVSVKKTSAHDTRLVDVDRIESASSSITTGQLGVNFIQKEKVSGKVLPRTLRVGIYAEDGTLISDTQDLFFGSESDNQRDWEVSVRLMLSDKSYDYNLKPVYLRLEERIKNTEYYTRYNEWRYELKRTIGFDF